MEGFDPILKYCEDWDFYIRLAAKYDFVAFPDWQIFYRRSSTSMTSTLKVELIEAFALIMLGKAYQLAPHKYQHLKKKSLAWVYEYSTQHQLRCSNDLHGLQIATQKFWRAVQLYPQILLEGYGQSLARCLIKRWLLFASNLYLRLKFSELLHKKR